MKQDFNFRCLEAVLGILISLQFIIADDIPGTSLQTGVWYTIKLKHRSAILTWADATVKSKHSNTYYNYADVVFGDVAKKEFEKGKKYYSETQWMLVKSETDGAYFIQNKDKQKAVLTYVDGVGDTDDFNWAVLFIDYNFKTNNDYLWKFVKNSDETYRLYNLAFPKNGALTLLESQDTGHKEKKYCRILLGDPGAINYEDDPKFSWSFESDTGPKMTPSTDMVPIKRIPGTGLWTGVYYTITMKSNEGKLNWSYTKVKSKASSIEYNYAQIVFGETARCEYNSKGAKYFAETKWMLVPTEDENGYVFRNMAEPEAVLTWVDDGNTNGYVWTVLYLGHAPEKDSDYAEGGKYRKDGSFRIAKNKDESYRIFNRRIEEQNKNGVMTFNRKAVTQDKRYCEFVTTILPDDQYIDDRDYHWIFRAARTQVRIKSIPGTTLFTGVSYTITLRGKIEPLKDKAARMVYSNKTFKEEGETYNYLYAAYGEYRKKEFLSHSPNYEYAQWVILESTKKGKYQLVNVAEEQSVIGWAGKREKGHYMVSHEDQAEHPDYQSGGKYYEDILWQFELIDKDGGIPFYNIYNSKFYPQGLVTWSGANLPEPERKYLVVNTAGSEKDKSDADFIWRFDPSKNQPNNRS